METLFKVTKKTLTGQSISVFIESDKFTNDIDLLANRRQQIERMLNYKIGDKIEAEVVKQHDLSDEERIEELEVIQNCLDQVQNRAKNFLSEKNYYTLYNLRCDIQDELTDLNGKNN
jgi:leucyl-tRNA synthetase